VQRHACVGPDPLRSQTPNWRGEAISKMSKGHAISTDPQNNPELHRDILADLKSWLAQLVADKEHRAGEMPEIEIGYVKRAIEEIERLRAIHTKTDSQPPNDYNKAR
jgi:hypothetical protein